MALFRYRIVLYPLINEYIEDGDIEKLGKKTAEYLEEFVEKARKVKGKKWFHETIRQCFEDIKYLAENEFPFIEEPDDFDDKIDDLYDILDTEIAERENGVANRFGWLDFRDIGIGIAVKEEAKIKTNYDYIIFQNGYESEVLKPYKRVINYEVRGIYTET